jgi:hypothetical protein
MKKNLSARIAERAAKKKPSRNAQNRAAFLALREDIKQALNDGWPVKTIWETLHEEGKITFSYQAFRGYVNRIILLAKAAQTPPAEGKIDAKLVPEEKSPKPPAGISGFKFDSTPSKEDII